MHAPFAVLLGAGASVDAGLPTTNQLTGCILDSLDDAQAAVAFYVLGVLQAEQGRLGFDPRLPISAERLAAAIELLADRGGSPISPFVQAWDPTIDGLDSYEVPRSELVRRVDNKLSKLIESYADPIVKQVDKNSAILNGFLSNKSKSWNRPTSIKRSRISSDAAKAIVDVVSRPGARHQGRFRSTSLAIGRALPLVLTPDESADLTYLDPLIRLSQGMTDPLLIGTLNYDLTIENRAASLGVLVALGVEGWDQNNGLAFHDKGIHLHKLHGSINWVRSNESVRIVDLDNATLRSEGPELIFGEGAKLQAEGPFLELFDGFRLGLLNVSQLLVVGYSFQDSHINTVLRRWLASNSDNRIVLVGPDDLISDESTGAHFTDALALDPRRPDQLTHIKETAKNGLDAAIERLEGQ